VGARVNEGTIASQARTTGLRVPIGHENVGSAETGFIKLRDDGDDDEPGAGASAGTDGMSMEMF